MSRQRSKRRWDPSKAWPPRWPSPPPGTDQRTLQEIEGIEWGRSWAVNAADLRRLDAHELLPLVRAGP